MMTQLLRQLLLCMFYAAVLGMAPEAKALGLLQAYDAALANDPAYRAAVQDNAAGQQFKVLGRAYLLPLVSASYSTNKNQADITTTSLGIGRAEHRNYTGLAASVQLRQPLFYPEGHARFNQGVAQTNASDAQFSVRSQDLIARLVTLYANTKFAEDQLEQAVAQREAYAELRLANKRMFLKGEGTRTDVLETQAKFNAAIAHVFDARDNLDNAREALAAMIGQDIATLDALSEDFKITAMQPASFDEWKNIALANNPEIAAQRYAIDVAEQEVLKNAAGHLPRLDLIASLSKSSSDTINTFNQNANTRSIGVQLNVPLYAGGSVSAATTQAAANHEKAKADLDGKTSQVLVELRKQYNFALSSNARIEATASALRSATLLVDATVKSVKGGQRTNLDVLNAQQQLFEAKRDLGQARYNYLLSFFRLRYSAGTLGLADLAEMAAYFVAGN